MNPWLFPWWGLLKGPLGGDVTQDMVKTMRKNLNMLNYATPF